MSETSTLISCTGRITRAELAKLPTPPATETHIPIPHAAVVETLVETLSHRQISVVGEEFAVSKDDMEMFGVLDLETSFEGCRFAIGIRNANNKRFRFGMHGGAASVRVSQSRVSRRLQPSWRNTRSGSRLKMLCRLAWTGCSETLNLCGGRWRAGEPSSYQQRRQS